MQKLMRFSLCIFAAALALAAMLAALAPAARAADWCVDPAGSPCYTTIAAAIGAAASGDTINIHAGTYHEWNLTVGKSLAFVGAGAGQTIVDGSRNNRVFYVTADGVSFSNLTIQNGSATGSGGGIYADSGNNLSLTNVDVLSSTSGGRGGGLASWKNTTTVTGGRFEANTCTGNYGGGLYAQSTLVVSGALFAGNTVSNTDVADGGGVYGNGPTTVTNSQFTGNVAGLTYGGGLYALSTVTLFNTRFVSNTAAFDGGGLYAKGAAAVTGGLFQDNRSVWYNGGGLFAESTLAVTDTQFLSNTGQMRGGGIYAASAATVTGGLFQNNHTHQFEGGGLAAWSTLALRDTQFISNASIYDGGGAFSVGAATVDGGLFQNNRTTFDNHSGGGLATAGTLALTGTRFLGNHSIWNGGGAYAAGGATLAGARFEDNSADRYGGGLMLGSGAGRVVNALFDRNTAGGAGAAMYLLDPAGAGGSVQVMHTTIASPTVGAGQAIVVGNGAVGITNTLIANYAAGIATAGSGAATSDYNLFYNAPASVVTGSHSIVGADPLFVDAAGGDYHLALGSPAIDAGADAGVTLDLDGVTRPQAARYDIGAFEFNHPLLTLAKSVAPAAAVPYHGVVTYTVVLSNVSVVNDAYVLMTDTLPAQVAFGAWLAAPPVGTSLVGRSITWTGSVAGGQAVTWTFTATQSSDLAQTMVNTAYFSGTQQAGDAAATFSALGPDRIFTYLPAILKDR